jgi:hypothetical protein
MSKSLDFAKDFRNHQARHDLSVKTKPSGWKMMQLPAGYERMEAVHCRKGTLLFPVNNLPVPGRSYLRENV